MDRAPASVSVGEKLKLVRGREETVIDILLVGRLEGDEVLKVRRRSVEIIEVLGDSSSGEDRRGRKQEEDLGDDLGGQVEQLTPWAVGVGFGHDSLVVPREQVWYGCVGWPEN